MAEMDSSSLTTGPGASVVVVEPTDSEFEEDEAIEEMESSVECSSTSTNATSLGAKSILNTLHALKLSEITKRERYAAILPRESNVAVHRVFVTRNL